MKLIRKIMVSALFLGAAANPAFADTMEVDDARAEMMEGKTDRGDIFMRITNSSDTADRLYAVRTKVAKRATLETESEADVVAGTSAETTSLPIRPGETLELTEEGAHIELFDLSRPFENGETFPVVLFFEQAGRITVTVTVGEEE